MVEEHVIEKVRMYDCLYNPKHKDYRNYNVRQTAWAEIGQSLQITGNAAKETWDKLRRCFVNARSRSLIVKRSGTGANKTVAWKFEEQMAFLLPFLETRKSHSNFETKYSVDFEAPQFDLTTGLDGNESPLEEHDVQSQQNVVMSQLKKRKEPSQSSAQDEMLNSLIESAALRKKNYEENSKSQELKTVENLDETDLFFLSMSRMTKQLPKIEQSRIKLQLSNLVLSAEMTVQESTKCSIQTGKRSKKKNNN